MAYEKALSAANLECASLSELSLKIRAPIGLMQLTPEQLTDWIAKIFSEYKSKLTDFHLNGTPPPSMAGAILEFRENYNFKALKAALTPASPPQPVQQHQFGNKSPLPTKPKPARERKPPAKPAKPAKPASQPAAQPAADKTAWPERSSTLTADAFAQLKAAAIAKWPGHCPFFLIGKCSHPAKCKKGAHDKPSGFAAFIDDQGFQINGVVSQPTTRQQHSSASTPARARAPHRCTLST